MSEALAVLRVGMCCPVGLDAAQTTSSLRAGVTRKRESSLLDDRLEPVILGYLADELLPPLEPSLTSWARRRSPLEVRMLRLAARPLREVIVEQLGRAALPVYLAAPTGYVSEQFLAALARQTGVAIDQSASRVFAGGGASWFEAAVAARDELLIPGRAKFVIVGGVDSYLDADRVEALERDGRLRTAGPQDALTPGEAAGFTILTTHAVCRRYSFAPLAWITHIGLATQTDEQVLGEGLASAVAAAIGPGPAEPIRLVMAGLSGESKAAKEWGVAYLRNREHFAAPLRVEHPAAAIGDAGAALAPVMLNAAALQLRAGMLAGPALVWARSDSGRRGALILYAGN
jgi:3-oxoacyl-[acyl-carrier-protein] synthase I